MVGLDFFYGIAKGQDDTIFLPIYRVRQSIAIAISRLREPPLGNYLAYKSVIDSLNRDGFALPRNVRLYDVGRLKALLSNGAKVDTAVTHAMAAPINTSLPPEILRGSEPTYADYIYASFLTFGVSVSSLYYFYFLILATSALIYLSEFYRNCFYVFVLGLYLIGIFLLEELIVSAGPSMAASL